MSNKRRLFLQDENGNLVYLEVLASEVLMANGQTAEEAIAAAGQVNTITLNGLTYSPVNKNINLGSIEIPEQVQADWEEDDPSDPAYIKRKPTVDKELDANSENAIANSIVTAAMESLRTAIDSVLGEGSTAAIENFQEVLDFLANVNDEDTLVGLLAALQTAVNGKVDKVNGYGLSKNDFTDTLKAKLDNIESGAQANPTMDTDPTAGNTNHTVSSAGVREAIDSKLTNVTVNALPNGTAMLDAEEANGMLYIFLAQAAAAMTVVPQNLEITGSAGGDIVIMGNGLTNNISIVASSGFSVDVDTLTPTDANGKTNIVHVSFTGDEATFRASGTVTFSCGGNVQAVNIEYSRGALPDGYQLCDYIQGGKNKYIKTGVNATSETRIVAKLQNNIMGEYFGLFGVRNGDSSIRLEAYEMTGAVQAVVMTGCAFGTDYRSSDTSTPHTIDMSKYRLIYDGVTYLNTNEGGGSDVSWQSTLQVEIGGLNNNGSYATPGNNNISLKIFYFAIYEGSTLVRQYIPAYETSTGKYGLFELVGGTFKASEGSSNFTGQIKS